VTQFHSFSVAGFPLTGEDGYGCEWTVEAVDGWFVGGGLRSSAQPRSQQNGSWRGRVYRDGRVLTLRGKVFCPDTTTLEQAGRRLSALLADGGFGECIGSSPAGTLSSLVQLDDDTLFDPISSNMATWQVTLGSEDPLLYGPEEFAQTTLAASAGGAGRVWPRVWPNDWGVPPGVTPGAITVANAGTASYFPRLRIDGPVTNPLVTLVETGDFVRFNGFVAAGQHLDINWGVPRRVTLGDNPVSVRHLTSSSGNWLAVPVGGGSIAYSADDADPAAVLSVWSYEGAWE
jgi:hypothetical protein